MNLKLYEINASIDAVLQLAVDGAMSDEDLSDNLEAIELSFDKKADAIACAIKNELAFAAASEAEAATLKARAKSAVVAAGRMSAYLSAQMLHAGKPSIRTSRNAISHRPSDTTVIDDLSNLPEEYLRRKPAPDPEADKNAIKAAIKAGIAVPGAHIETRQCIQIK